MKSLLVILVLISSMSAMASNTCNKVFESKTEQQARLDTISNNVINSLGYEGLLNPKANEIYVNKQKGIKVLATNSDTETHVKVRFVVKEKFDENLSYDAYYKAESAFEKKVLTMGRAMVRRSRNLKLMRKNDSFNFSGFTQRPRNGYFEYSLEILVNHKSQNPEALSNNYARLIELINEL